MQRIRYSRYLKTAIILLDLVVIAMAFVYYFISTNSAMVHDKEMWYENSFPLMLVIFFWILLSGRTKIYNISRNLTYILFVERLIIHFLLFTIGLVLIRKVSANQFFGSELTWLSLSLFFVIFIIKSVVYFSIRFIRSKGINHRNVMFLSETDSTNVLKKIIKDRKDFGYKVFDYNQTGLNKENLVDFWKKNGIHTLFIPTENQLSPTEQSEMFLLAEANKVHITLIPNISKNSFFFYDLGYIETQPVLNQAKYPLDYYSNFLLKRVFDVIFSILVLVLICSWLFPIIAVLIKRSSKGPVFFIQKRYGYHEEIFNCIKFRTMVVNEDSSQKTTGENDVRITAVGKFLRKTSLDEMPQFINVLKGEMSIVGPRPHMLAVDNFYKPKIGRYTLRSHTYPGITGLAQVSGLRGDTGDVEVEMNKRILADSFYIRNWSFIMDLAIILKTIILFITGDKKAK